jgi:hypothetical protein
MATIVVGTALIYGIADDVTAMAVQSYSCDSAFNSDVTAQDKDGITITQRLDDRMSDLTVEGILESAGIPQLGDTLTFTLNAASAYPGATATASYVGVIIKISEKGSSKGFATVSLTAKAYEGA